MFRKALIALSLLGATALSGCVVYAPPPRAVYYDPAPAVVVGPIFPIPLFGFYGGYYHGYGGGYHHWR